MNPKGILALALVCVVAVWQPISLIAQDRTVVFVHGLISNGGTWTDAAARLQGQLKIASHTPTVDWQSTYEMQAGSLQSQLWWMPSNGIAIGHSNGGIVSRELSKSKQLGAVITLSTPHRGGPLLYNIPQWFDYNVHLLNDIMFQLYNLFGGYEWAWLHAILSPSLSFVWLLQDYSIPRLATFLGYQVGAPVLGEMLPNSGFQASINSSANLAREAAAIPTRIGIVDIAQYWYDGGVARAIAPAYADAISIGIQVASGGFFYWSVQVLANSNGTNPNDPLRAAQLAAIGYWLLNHEEAWCRTISEPVFLAYAWCHENDSLVPWDSQVYPGATNLVKYNTPVHIEQTQGMDPVLSSVLSTYLQVPPRNGGSPGPDTMVAGQRLYPGQSIASLDGQDVLFYQSDGNLVLSHFGVPTWASQTSGTSAGWAEMQGDGNLVVRNATATAVYASWTDGNGGAFLRLENDGGMVIRSVNGAVIWENGVRQY